LYTQLVNLFRSTILPLQPVQTMPSKPAKLQTKGLGSKALKSASLPSELSRSPMPWTPADVIKSEDMMKTPITPPVAYTDFLRALSSPGGVPLVKPSTTSNPSTQPSTASTCSCSCENHQSPASAYPPTPYTFPLAATSRKLRIPASPACSPGSDSPTSAQLMQSPFSLRSPHEWDSENKIKPLDLPRSGDRVCVRQVVTRTVTYTTRSCPQMNLAPAPKGKRRRLE
jgi:hypothetical protein